MDVSQEDITLRSQDLNLTIIHPSFFHASDLIKRKRKGKKGEGGGCMYSRVNTSFTGVKSAIRMEDTSRYLSDKLKKGVLQILKSPSRTIPNKVRRLKIQCKPFTSTPWYFNYQFHIIASKISLQLFGKDAPLR